MSANVRDRFCPLLAGRVPGLTLALAVTFALALALVASGCGHPAADTGEPASAGSNAASGVHRHDDPGETCFLCDETKRDPGRLWCKEHGRYEDRCFECHPELREKGRPYCEEHGLYEDECFLCHPELSADAEEEADAMPRTAADADPGLMCTEHRVPEAKCAICRSDGIAALEPGAELEVRLPSPRSASMAGIRTAPARRVRAQASVPALCEVSYDENSLARITPLSAGIVRGVLVDVGEDVMAGDPLVDIHSSEVANAKAAFVSAVVDHAVKEAAFEREQRLAEKAISSEEELQEAEAACRTAEVMLGTARQRLLNYGFTAQEVATIDKERDTTALLRVRAPFDGTLVQRHAVIGEAVETGRSLFLLADLASMWLSLSIPADRADLVRKGRAVEATFRGLAGETVRGEITWVDTAIDRRTRMLHARAVVANTGRKLSAGMFGDARILVGSERDAVDVPAAAIQRFEGEPYVFVRIEDDLYALRRVTTVERPGTDTIAVTAGLRPDEPVVVTGGFTVMSEVLKSRLGAGCCAGE